MAYINGKKTTFGAILNLSPGGSSKIYKHRVKIETIYNEETWADDPEFRFYISFYRSDPTPITSFDDIQEHELLLERLTLVREWDAPDATHTASGLGKTDRGLLRVEYIRYVYEYYETICFDTDYVDFSPNQFTITDTVYEV